MVEDRVDNLLSKKSVEIKVDRSPLGENKIVVFRGKLENLLLKMAINYITVPVVMLPVNMCKSNDLSLRRLRSKVFRVACETGVGWGIL